MCHRPNEGLTRMTHLSISIKRVVNRCSKVLTLGAKMNAERDFNFIMCINMRECFASFETAI